MPIIRAWRASIKNCVKFKKEIVFYTGSGVSRDYDKGDTDYCASFGQYDLSGISCCGIGGSAEYRRFLGIPGGEIVGRRKATCLDPSKKDKPYDEQVVKIRYFYVRSKLPIRVPLRHPNHWV